MEPTRTTPPLEKAEYEACVRLLRLVGVDVYRLVQPRRTMMTPGIPDAWLFGPGKLYAWFECKRPGGRLRPEQRKFREQCEARKIEHVVGGIPEIERLLVRWGLARVEPSGQLVLTPRRAA